MKLAFDVKEIHVVHEPTLLDNVGGKQVAPVGSVVVTLADDTRFAFDRHHFMTLFPKMRLNPDTKRFEDEIPVDATPITQTRAAPAPKPEEPEEKPKPKTSRAKGSTGRRGK